MRRGKILAFAVTVLALLAVIPFAAAAEEPVKNGWYRDKGYYEYFSNGMQYKNHEYYISESNAYFRFDSNGRMYESEWYQNPKSGKYSYYMAGGFRATACITQASNGYYYGFDYNGLMFDNEDFSFYSSSNGKEIYGRATAGGPLTLNTWVWFSDDKNDKGGFYRYFGENGAAYIGINRVGGALYFFEYDGAMLADGTSGFYDSEIQKYFYVRAKADGSLYNNEWYKQTYNDSTYYEWYYYGDNGCAANGLTTIGSATYYFDDAGRMLTNGTYYDENESCSYYADKNGLAVRLNQNGWTLIGSDYYYCEDGRLVTNEIKTVGWSNYYFDYSGKMLNNSAGTVYKDNINLEIRAKAGGALYCNEWYWDGYDYYYYGSDCNKIEDGFKEIDGRLFYFVYGYAYRNRIFEFDGKVYVADNSCAVTNHPDGWIQISGEFYFAANNQLLKNCITDIGGCKYIFDDSGRMYTEGRVEFGSGDYYNYYLITASGAVVTQQGWAQCDGQWYYVTEDSSLYRGFLDLNGNKYYLFPEMEYAGFDYDGNKLYLVTPSGVMQEITTDGYYDTEYGRMLVENGKLFKGWKQVNGSWYYYDPVMITGDYYFVDNGYYYFDTAGVMKANGWIPYGDSYLYADEYGRLTDNGVATIGGATYLFTAHSLSYNRWYKDNNGSVYVSDNNAYATKLNDNGWTNVNGYFYYTTNGNIRLGSSTLDDGEYYFDSQTGRMLADVLQYNSYYDTYGRLYTGWKQIDGVWYYFGPYKYSGSCRSIDGKDYCFDNYGRMLANTTYYVSWENRIYVIDAYGVVTDSCEAPEGIIYQDGSAYLYGYNGWYGEYYFRNGRMAINDVITDNGVHYYLDTHGKYIRNGWHKYYENWMYANEYGKLCYNEWAYIGNSWYYFSGPEMVSDDIWYIESDGKYAKFDASGRFLGYVDEKASTATGYANTWEYVNGKYRYYNSTGTAVSNETLYIDGRWYVFDHNGYMLSNTFAFVNYYHSDRYYYTASGARLEASNQWKMIDGKWFYFGPDSSVVEGWIDIYGTRYYIGFDFEYDETTDEERLSDCGMYTGYRLIDGKVYYFYENGACYGEYVGNGWLLLADGDYVYFKDGKLLESGIHTINGVKYYFNSDNRLLTNGCANNYYSVYASASGALYGAGWHYTDKGWIYVNGYGDLLYNGVYEIGGVVYFFSYGYMV